MCFAANILIPKSPNYSFVDKSANLRSLGGVTSAAEPQHPQSVSVRKFKQFHIDWLQLPKKLIAEATALLGAPCAYEGTHIYTSYDGKTDSGKKHHKWATDWLDRQAGMPSGEAPQGARQEIVAQPVGRSESR